MPDYATRYRQTHGDSNQHITEADLAELKARVTMAETIAERAAALIKTTKIALREYVSVVSFQAAAYNDLIDALAARETVIGPQGQRMP